MMKLLQVLVYISVFCVSSVVGAETCHEDYSIPQCSEGQLCFNNTCQHAIPCSSDDDCYQYTELACISDYCQRTICDGSCVYGQTCDFYGSRHCQYPIDISVAEGSDLTLSFAEPATPGSYKRFYWYKYNPTDNSRLLVLTPGAGSVDCKGICFNSDEVHIDIETGNFTFKNVRYAERGRYYYSFDTADPMMPDTGHKYVYRINVYVLPTLTIEGMPTEPVEVGTNVNVTCIADRNIPDPLEMYWEIDTRRENGTRLRMYSNSGNRIANTLVYSVAREDNGKLLSCVIVSVYGDTIRVQKVVTIVGYAPSGRPTVKASALEQYNGDRVTLTCENPPSSGNPDCDLYSWRRLEGNINFTPETQIYTFIMDEFHAGNYTCRCRNEFGESEVSDAVEIINLGEKPIESNTSNTGVVVGVVVAVVVVVVVVLVVVGVVVCKRYNIKILSRNNEKQQKNKDVDDAHKEPVIGGAAAEFEEPVAPAGIDGVIGEGDGGYEEIVARAGIQGVIGGVNSAYEEPVARAWIHGVIGEGDGGDVEPVDGAVNMDAEYEELDEAVGEKPVDGGYKNIVVLPRESTLSTYDDIM